MTRRGVMLLMFDLPVKTGVERSNYAKFRKGIIKRGYISFQKSVYIRLLKNISSAASEKRWLDACAPQKGKIHAMSMSLNEFKTLTAVRGENFDIVFFSDDIVIAGQYTTRPISDEELVQLDTNYKERRS